MKPNLETLRRIRQVTEDGVVTNDEVMSMGNFLNVIFEVLKRVFEDARLHPHELKKILLRHQPQFAKALTKKLLAYAIGREMTVNDRPQIDSLAQSATGFRDLITSIALSDTFRSK